MMKVIIEKSALSDQYQEMDYQSTNFVIDIDELLEMSGERDWSNCLRLSQEYEEVGVISALTSHDPKFFNKFVSILDHWEQFYRSNFSRLKLENEQSGSETRKSKEMALGKLIDSVGKGIG